MVYLYLLVMLVFLHVKGMKIEEFVLACLVHASQRIQNGQVEVTHRRGRIVLQNKFKTLVRVEIMTSM